MYETKLPENNFQTFADRHSSNYLKKNIKYLHAGRDRIEVLCSDNMKYLGTILDSCLSMKNQIKNKCKAAIFNIKCISKIRSFIDINTAKILASSLVLSHLDYCNIALIGLPKSTINVLQKVQNWCAKVVLKRCKFDSSSKALAELHWLPIRERIIFKTIILVYKCVHGLAPKYLCELLKFRVNSRTTRSGGQFTLFIPFTSKKTLAARSFSVEGPRLWNELPSEIRTATPLSLFRKKLKTYLFPKF